MIIWTRSHSDWSKDAALLQGLPEPVTHLPCLETRALPVTPPNCKPTILLFTSANAVDYFIANTALYQTATSSSPRVYCFGDKTHAALAKTPLSLRKLNARSSPEFGNQLVTILDPREEILIMGAKEPASDLKGFLGSKGLKSHYLSLYETVTPSPGLPWPQSPQAYVVFASPSAVKGFCTLYGHEKLKPLTALVLGETTAKACRPLVKHVVIAKEQTVEALVGMLRQMLAKRGAP